MQKAVRHALAVGLTTGIAIALQVLGAGPAMAGTQRVFTQTNSPRGNAVVALERGADGALRAGESVPTGGFGSGGGLGSHGAVALSDDGRHLLAVDAGSDDVAIFRVGVGGLALVTRVASGGARPISVDIDGDRAYVLNADSLSVSSFAVGVDGTPTPLAGGTVALAEGAAGPVQVSVAPSGDSLVVTERHSHRLETIPLDEEGRPGTPVVTPSSGSFPFGFGFGHRGDVIVAEATAGTVSSYRLTGTALQLVTASLPTNQGAAVLGVAVSPDGRHAYTGNVPAGSVSGFAIGTDGALTALDADGRTASAPRPHDLAFSVSGRFLYVLNPGGVITGFRVASDGSLEPSGAHAVPAGSQGLAAR